MKHIDPDWIKLVTWILIITVSSYAISALLANSFYWLVR